MPGPLLRLSDINKSFAAVHALREVSFELLSGEVHAVVGENGAGKSTLVSVVTGAQRPDSGEIEIQDQVVEHLDPKRSRHLGIACIYQHPALFPDLTVAENIGLRLEEPAAFRAVKWGNRHARAADLLKRIGANISPDSSVRELSMPHQQLVEIACAVGAEARIVIMDEPTASLTRHEQDLLFGVVRQLRGQGVGIIYVSHRLDEVFALSDRVTVLRDGTKVCTAITAQLNESSVIRLMVGREVKPTEHQTETVPGRVVLSMRNLGCSESGVGNINLDVSSGEILGLAGLVGAGRTELAETLFGITPADSGEIIVDGRKIEVDSPQAALKAGIAYVPEDRGRHGIIQELTIEQNISLAVHKRLFRGSWLRPRIERQLAADYIGRLDIKPPVPVLSAGSLSGGNQQKVLLARWLASNPRLLILDEPTQGVDVGAKMEIHKIIRKLANHGLAVLLISSDLPELLQLSDRIGVMRGGQLVAFLPAKADSHQVMALAFGKNASAA